jgi:hypothetical protein
MGGEADPDVWKSSHVVEVVRRHRHTIGGLASPGVRRSNGRALAGTVSPRTRLMEQLAASGFLAGVSFARLMP